MTPKHLFDYFEKDPEVQTRYLLNCINNGLRMDKSNSSFTNLHNILSSSFIWSDTIEGQNYWENVYYKLVKKYKGK